MARGKGLHLLDTLDAESRGKGLHIYVHETNNKDRRRRMSEC